MLWQLCADHEQKQELGGVTITQGLDARRPITEALLGHCSEKPLGINDLEIRHICNSGKTGGGSSVFAFPTRLPLIRWEDGSTR
jgi:hypothetical protein